MEWLSLWLKKIILLVLLAAFLDLILPNTNLQRYVKMVMGLIILLTIMSPVFTIFNLSQEDLALRMSRYQQEMLHTSDSEWKTMTNRLLSSQDEQAVSYVKKQMEGMIRAQVKESYDVELAQVTVNVEKTEQSLHIARISLVVAESQQDKAGAAHEQARPAIKPIEPVRINLDGSETSAVEKEERIQPPKVDPLSQQIQQLVANTWALAPVQVQVSREMARKE